MGLATKMVECETCRGEGWYLALGRRFTCGTCYGAGSYETWDDSPDQEAEGLSPPPQTENTK